MVDAEVGEGVEELGGDAGLAVGVEVLGEGGREFAVQVEALAGDGEAVGGGIEDDGFAGVEGDVDEVGFGVGDAAVAAVAVVVDFEGVAVLRDAEVVGN